MRWLRFEAPLPTPYRRSEGFARAIRAQYSNPSVLKNYALGTRSATQQRNLLISTIAIEPIDQIGQLRAPRIVVAEITPRPRLHPNLDLVCKESVQLGRSHAISNIPYCPLYKRSRRGDRVDQGPISRTSVHIDFHSKKGQLRRNIFYPLSSIWKFA